MNYEQLKKAVQVFIKQSFCDEADFNNMAVNVFTFQYNHNPIFRKFCKKKRVSSRKVKSYRDIPVVPIHAFKDSPLTCTDPEEAEAIFMTSGTTNPNKRGKNVHRDLETWKLSMTVNFEKSIMQEVEQLPRIINLFPPVKEMPHSSLANYLNVLMERFGASNSDYVVSKGGLEAEKLHALLQGSITNHQPVFVLGATYSFIHFLEYCEFNHMTYELPKGSLIMDTGGSKGKTREVSSDKLKQKFSEVFGVPLENCKNMYGMTELSSQFYDVNAPNRLVPPHWVKTLIVDPVTKQPVEKGEKGIIVHYDLANFNSACAIMTEDVGVAENDGFRLLGRAEGAEAKGCSLAVEEFLSSHKGGI